MLLAVSGSIVEVLRGSSASSGGEGGAQDRYCGTPDGRASLLGKGQVYAVAAPPNLKGISVSLICAIHPSKRESELATLSSACQKRPSLGH